MREQSDVLKQTFSTPMSIQVARVYDVFLKHFGRKYRETFTYPQIVLISCGFCAGLDCATHSKEVIEAVRDAITSEVELFYKNTL